ncbi:MAG: DNA-binding response regulator [Acidimicrobiaceae bacterium]|nr:DNA-binding response regulator [Acidimicrobiaceae bacterium]MCH2634205.1 response regulator transcription factor [Acidimicrobiales bacterium]MEC9089459.1 response regulator transcription factor [Actinomycetota bacterium]HCK74115.1 DNA-binding response regulator [Acidimicrobiaceae bacterium]|tara:strand:+ start:5148 stop:5849 length:702 start_codon:yes stop_codon:yes gene_type:complete
MTSILVVDDEPVFIEALTISLEREGFGVIAAADGPAALKAISEKDPDLILLDVMLPGMSGIDVCREIRKSSSVPVIMVTAKGEEIDAVVGLEVGADDYITKPYRLRELIARIRAILRRSENSPKEDETTSNPEVLVEGAVRLDLERHELSVDGELVSLALREFELLSYLMENSGRVVTRESLMQNVWGWDYIGDTKTIDVHVKRLRSKIESDPSAPLRISTIRGVGYRYERSG